MQSLLETNKLHKEVSSTDISLIRNQFPIFSRQPGILFFDNAATSQKPQSVISTFNDFYSRQCTNAGRASHRFSTWAQNEIEKTRAKVARFLNCSAEDLIFTSGASESLNAVASIWGLSSLQDGDEVILCLQDHRSAVLPWFNIQTQLKNRGVNISIFDIQMNDVGEYNLSEIKKRLSPRTRIVAITHVHHVYGQDTDVRKVREAIGDDVLISLDASQAVGHLNFDLRQLDVDFVSFSGHKMFAGNGTGILWVNLHRVGHINVFDSALLHQKEERMELRDSRAEGWRHILEHGTQNIPAILSFSAAISFIQDVGIDFIESHVRNLTVVLYNQLKDLPGIEFSPGIHHCKCANGYGIVSFRFDQVGVTDLGLILDGENILARDGGFCQARQDQSSSYIRISMHVYNTETEIQYLIDTLKKHIC